jgi:hypothetical protein
MPYATRVPCVVKQDVLPPNGQKNGQFGRFFIIFKVKTVSLPEYMVL